MPPADVLRACIVGAESTGKTTLAAALAARLGTVWNPEYGRVYTEVGRECGTPWASSEFAHIARIHCWYEDFLAGLANRVLVCDTDAFTTALFHEAYLGTPAAGFEREVSRRYDLYLVCGTDVSFTHDGWREFEAQRMWMHERLLEHALDSGSPWLLVEGPPDVRLEAAVAGVERLLESGSDRKVRPYRA